MAITTGTPKTGSETPAGSRSDEPPKVDAREIAWWAETAHGFKGLGKRFLVDTKKGVRFKEKDELGKEPVLAIVETDAAAPNREPPDSVTAKIGGETYQLKDKCDALFWTESAIEKFFIPYYEAQRLLDPDKMDKLKKLYRDERTVALGHMPPSHEMVLPPEDCICLLTSASPQKGVESRQEKEWIRLGELLRKNQGKKKNG